MLSITLPGTLPESKLNVFDWPALSAFLSIEDRIQLNSVSKEQKSSRSLLARDVVHFAEKKHQITNDMLRLPKEVDPITHIRALKNFLNTHSIKGCILEQLQAYPAIVALNFFKALGGSRDELLARLVGHATPPWLANGWWDLDQEKAYLDEIVESVRTDKGARRIFFVLFERWMQDPESVIRKIDTLDFRTDFPGREGLEVAILPEAIGKLVNLKTLNLSRIGLISLPSSIGKLENLETLILAFNHLSSLPDSMKDLVNLKGLQLRNNCLTSIPPFIGMLHHLERFDLSNNPLASPLPDSMKDLVNLKELYLGGLDLTFVPPWVGNLVNLWRLDLSNNHITSLPHFIENLVELIPEELLLEGNPL